MPRRKKPPRQLLDAIAFAALPEELLVRKLAARFWDVSIGFTLTDIDDAVVARWVKQNFGPLFEPGHEVRLTHAVAIELVRQRMISLRRYTERRNVPDKSISARRLRLLNSVLGPPDHWATRKVLADGKYLDSVIRQDLIVGLVRTDSPVTGSASLLVFRSPQGAAPRSWWVNRSETINDALLWVAGPIVEQGIAEGTQVEVEWAESRFRLVDSGGRVTYVPWRRRRGRSMT